MTKNKKHLEFSQKWLLGWSIATLCACIIAYTWSALGFDALENLAISIVQVLGAIDVASFAGYTAQNSVRAHSANKFGPKIIEEEKDDSDEIPISSCKN